MQEKSPSADSADRQVRRSVKACAACENNLSLMMEVVVTTGTISRAKLQSNDQHQQTNIISWQNIKHHNYTAVRVVLNTASCQIFIKLTPPISRSNKFHPHTGTPQALVSSRGIPATSVPVPTGNPQILQDSC